MLNVLEIIVGILLLIISVTLIFVVMLQESKSSGMSGALTGGMNDSYMSGNGGRTREAILAKWTKILAITFFVLVLAASLIKIVA